MSSRKHIKTVQTELDLEKIHVMKYSLDNSTIDIHDGALFTRRHHEYQNKCNS